MVELLPYQDGRTLPTDDNDHDSTEILDIATTTESRTHLAMGTPEKSSWLGNHLRSLCLTHQIFKMVRKPCSMLTVINNYYKPSIKHV